MAVTAERFAQGLLYEDFKAQMTRNQERFAANEQQFHIDPADLTVFQHLPQPLNVLVLAEDWCGDVIENLPILGRIAEQSGTLTLRVFLRDQNLDLIDQYLKDGKYRSIPVFVFFDDHFNEIGCFIERPDSTTERRAQQRKELYAQHPEFGSPDTPFSQLPEEVRLQLQQAMANWREQSKVEDNQEVVRSLRTIVEAVRV